MKTKPSLQQFRDTVYQAMPKRADATFDLLDALTSAGHVESPVALSEEILFRRRFSSVYDALEEGEMKETTLRSIIYRSQPEACETIAGFEVYATDATPNPRPEAETLPDRGMLKSQREQVAEVGYKFNWLVRLVKQGSSWVAPQDMQRVATSSTDSQVAAEQVKALDKQSDRLKVVVADSLYGNQYFLAVFLVVTTVFALVRLRSNLRLYEQPQPKPPKSKGRPPVHGSSFKLTAPPRPADRTEMSVMAGQTVRLSAWQGLHLRKLPALVGMLVLVEFLKADGSRRYKTPIYLLWTGPWTVALADLCQMYLWRFAIEHAFRFLKQRLGLNANRSPNSATAQRWMWLVALAYWQLFLMSPDMGDYRPLWHRRPPLEHPYTLTPGQVQRGALSFLLALGTPAASPRPAGKGVGRPKGYQPRPKKRQPVVRKSQKRAQKGKKKAITVT